MATDKEKKANEILKLVKEYGELCIEKRNVEVIAKKDFYLDEYELIEIKQKSNSIKAKLADIALNLHKLAETEKPQ